MLAKSFTTPTGPLPGELQALRLEADCLVLSQVVRGEVLNKTSLHKIRLAGTTFHRIASGGAVAGAAKGAFFGGLLGGGLGALAGAALGGTDTHSFAIHTSGYVLVAEFSTKDLQQLGAHGVLFDGTTAPGAAKVELGKAKGSPTGSVVVLGALCALMVSILILMVFKSSSPAVASAVKHNAASPSVSRTSATRVELNSLLTAYEQSAAKAAGEFSGKEVTFSGTVRLLKRRQSGGTSLTIGPASRTKPPLAQCTISSTNETVEQGASVTVVGKVGRLRGNLWIDECRLR